MPSYGSVNRTDGTCTNEGPFGRYRQWHWTDVFMEGGFDHQTTSRRRYGPGCYCLLVLIVTALLIGLPMPALPSAHHTRMPTNALAARFDYIIVGGGPAGSVLANRLSAPSAANKLHNVLLLEAGAPSQFDLGGRDFVEKPLTRFDIPLLWTSVTSKDEYHWPIENALVAKALGGCGVHNGMLYVRGLPQDVSGWNQSGWDWPTVLDYYKRAENFTDWDEEGGQAARDLQREIHGVGGMIQTSAPVYVDPIAPYFVEACEEAGLARTRDFNAVGGREGAGYYHFNTRWGVRDSAARAYLAPIMGGSEQQLADLSDKLSSSSSSSSKKRKNLTVMTGANVRQIIWEEARDGEEPIARGVEFVDAEGEVYSALLLAAEGDGAGKVSNSNPNGHRGVILSAGAINTPRILQASGVGDRERLRDLGIDVRVHAPQVGKHLQDHPAIGITFELGHAVTRDMPTAFDVAQQISRYAAGVKNAWEKQDGSEAFGVYASSGLTAGGFLRPEVGGERTDLPEIQLTAFPQLTEPHLVRHRANNHSSSSSNSPNVMLVQAALLRADAEYEVSLNGSDPFGAPCIRLPDGDATYLSDADVDKLVWAVKEVRRIQRTDALSKVTGAEVSPGAHVATDAQLSSWVRANAVPNSHWSSSVRMGSDAQSTVDSRLKVRGSKQLRVVDASVLPDIPNGNVHSTVVMVAERAADLILEDASATW